MEAQLRNKELGQTVSDEVQALLTELETTVLEKKETYHSVFNQPERICLSTANAEAQTEVVNATSESSSYQFTINLPRPALNVKSMQLISANIPQAQVCIPDSACVFWYYRLRTQTLTWPTWSNSTAYTVGDYVTLTSTVPFENYICITAHTGHRPNTPSIYWTRTNRVNIEVPNINALLMNRLLPSYYKQEFITNAANYGYNETFATYQQLATQLAKISVNDLAVTNDVRVDYLYPFVANDASITYNAITNKFQFTGLKIAQEFSIDTWLPTITYPPQSIVAYGGHSYYNQAIEVSNIPGVAGTWLLYTSSVYYTYLVASAADTNVSIAQGLLTKVQWNSYHTYMLGDVVVYNGITYTCLISNINKLPTNITYWSATGIPSYTGLNTMTEQYDFGAGVIPYIAGIPGQPYYNTTLNSRLGFSWGGQNMASGSMGLSNISNYPDASLVTLFFNRLRPVPQYTPNLFGLELGLGNAYDSSTYTADAFCNMVYSSVVSIYSRIVGGSTTDTQKNTNLLAIVPMACGNLGITFANNFIDNPLTKMDRDIYSLSISLYTETGEPYWLSNNGIATFTLKLTYE